MMKAKEPLRLTISLADQEFARTKSVGIFNVALGLTRQLATRPEEVSLTALANASIAPELGLPATVLVRSYEASSRRRLARLWWDQWGVYSAARRVGPGWLLLPKGFASFLRRPPFPLAAYVHDAMHDFYSRNRLGKIAGIEDFYFVRSLRATLRQAQVCFTNTAFTEGEVRRLADAAGLPAPRTAVAGIGFDAIGSGDCGDRRGVVVLASPFPHKRTALAIEWFARWQEATGFGEEIDWIGRLPTGVAWPSFSNWRHHPRLPEAEFRARVGRARALVFFSDYEGFGMPPVEAALAGACPVFSEIPPTREVMGPCGCGFLNTDYESFRSALDAAIQMPGETISRWSAELRSRHNWAAVADRVLAGLRS
jgi:hypothetical protein